MTFRTIHAIFLSMATILLMVVSVPSTAQRPDDPAGTLPERYLRKQADLAEHRYRSAVRENERIPLLNSKQILLRLRQRLDYAKLLVDRLDASGQDPAGLQVASLELVKNDAEMAKQRLKWALEASENSVTAIPDDTIRRYLLEAELAELALERAKQKDYFDDPMNHLQWQLNRLRSDVAELQIQIERTQSGS